MRAEACHTLCQLWKKREGDQGGGEGGGEETFHLISTLRERLIVEDDAMVTRQLTSALAEMGGSVDRNDPQLDFIRSEVQRLGTCHAITQGVLENDITAMTDYIITRPLGHLTTRDYLSHHQRLV